MLLPLVISNILFTTSALENDYSDVIQSFIYTFDEKEEIVTYVRDLKDIYGNCSYELYRVGDDGYAIVTIETQNILEISYGNFPKNSKQYYVSSGEFLDENEFGNKSGYSLYSMSEDTENSYLLYKVTDNILNENHLSFKFETDNISTYGTRPYPTKPTAISGGTVVGISDSSMDIFNSDKWINKTNQCGAYAAAVMITYMDKYHGGKYFIENGSYSEGKIIDCLKKEITGSSSANQLLIAINNIFLADYPKGGKHGTVTSSESTYKSKISSKYPVCLLLQSFKSSLYGDHWVCGYQYVDYNGRLWFKAHDNWSGNNHRGWINRNWIYKGVYTN